MFGTIVHYRADRGFGFIRQAGEVADVFFHVTEFWGDPELLRAGTKVEFSLGERKGKRLARDVRVLAEDPEVAAVRAVLGGAK